MSLMTNGIAPGPVRFHLACDRMGCRAEVSFDLVIADSPPDTPEDHRGGIPHEAGQARPYIRDMGWHITQGGEGYRCPACSLRRG
ncbi:hypothetical protein [Streptomyces sp. PT12]|uniref:hypothetical protein n=1 Tax=Streptomyces sp. PT12 TaxID=1510197 RepID=UPI000DE4C741|nr:hypothetical protein [Streptomyces sp. PT12]RBM16500.1 hypothetical protein DEH69_16805 [Streptomyces sp. PT12]